MKPMTVNELWDSCDREPQPIFSLVCEIVDKARLGMIPEEEVIRIPPEKEWPEWAKWIRVQYLCGYPHMEAATITVIPIKPAWAPNVGEPVFTANMHFDVVRYGVVTVVANGGVGVIFPDGSRDEYTFDRVKPGITTYIGKHWSEIPEA